MSRGILVTRPAEDSAPLADALRQRGFTPLIEPMLDIRYRDAPVPGKEGYQAVLLTSANGARALARLVSWRDLPVWAVGEASAAEARRLGFASVRSAGGDVASLAALVAAESDPAGGPFLQIAASRLAGDLAGMLTARGFTLDKSVLYDAEPAAGLSPALRAALAEDALEAALFFSPRTAATFVTLASAMAESLRRIKALALSRAVAEALAPLPWKAVAVADRPEQARLLSLLDGE